MILELLLNIAWVALGATALLLWAQKWRNGSAQKVAVGFVALICVVILLFPIISATDDSQALARSDDGPNATKRPLLDASWTLLLVVPLAIVSSQARAADAVACDSLCTYSYLQTVHITNRPPPQL